MTWLGFLLGAVTDNVHRGGGHELGAHELHKVPVGEPRHGVGEGERPHGGDVPGAGERDLAADHDQGHRQGRDHHQEHDEERPHVQLPVDASEARELGVEEAELGVGEVRPLARDLRRRRVEASPAWNRSVAVNIVTGCS